MVAFDLAPRTTVAFEHEDRHAQAAQFEGKGKAGYSGRILESNLMDLQGLLSLITGIRANAVEDESLTPEEAKPEFYSKHWRIFCLEVKELVILPLLLLCKLENILFSFMKGSLIVVELTKE